MYRCMLLAFSSWRLREPGDARRARDDARDATGYHRLFLVRQKTHLQDGRIFEVAPLLGATNLDHVFDRCGLPSEQSSAL